MNFNHDLTGFYYHPSTGFIAKKVGQTRFSGTYKLVNIRCVQGTYILKDLNLHCHDNDLVPAETVQFLKDLEITRSEIEDELTRTYGYNYSDR